MSHDAGASAAPAGDEPGRRASAGPDLGLAEEFFVLQGLPYFVDSVRQDVQAALRRRRLLLVVAGAVAIGAVSGAVAGLSASLLTWWTADERVGQVDLAIDVDLAFVAGVTTATVVVLGYAMLALHGRAITAWAGRRTFASLGSMFPLVTRALPLLLLFITFLFINAEVWEVSSRLEGSVMWLTVALFLTITVGFLLARLPEELEGFDSQLDTERIAAGTRGTPLDGWHEPLGEAVLDEIAHDEIRGLQRANLILVLLVAQLVQVLLLSLAVFLFFVIFGLLVMEPGVIEGWTGEDVRALPWFERANTQLLQVSTFLAAFSGLYFTVYAVTDETYRTQFFTSILRELERAVSARVVYRALRRTRG